jgi:glycosyltransferase involved in cell wall biosynthesis
MLSIVIPSYKDPLLQKTIDSLLENAEGEIEIIAILDGYWPNPPLRDDKRLKIIHLGKNRGMRGAINAGVDIAKGEFLMRTDEHCIFGKGYDRILTENFSENWIVTPRRYFLDPVKWEVMDIPPVDYCDLRILGKGSGRKFTGLENKKMAEERKDIMIDETKAMQGSCWIMKKSWWDAVIGELQIEGYGPLYQDSHEMVFKTWKKGGKLMVNKNTWYAHKHRDFKRTHNNGTKENPSNNEACFAYSLEVWEDYYNELLKQWERI